MKRYNRILLLLSLLFLGCSDDTIDNQEDQLLEQRLSTLGPSLLEEFGVNGLAVAYIKDGQVVFKEGFGLSNVEKGTEVTPETIFNIGSVSKMFTGIGAMNLVRQGKLTLDDPIESFLSTWNLPPSSFDHSRVTLARLFRHTGGTSIAGYPGYRIGSTMPTLVESLSGKGSAGEGVKIIYNPGTETQYSGGGISVIQLAIEETSGMPFEQFLNAEIFSPIGMNSTGFDYTQEVLKRIAVPYDRNKGKVAHTDFTETGAAGMLSTLNDLVAFALKIIENKKTGSSEILGIDVETINMTMEVAENAVLNWQTAHQVRLINGMRVIGHIGTNNGWRCNLQIAPTKGHAIITMANGSSGGPDNAILCEWINELTDLSSSEFCP